MGNRGLSQIPLSSFTGGELSPKLGARVDLEKYLSGCRQLQNATVFPYGGFTRRPGSEYIATAKFDAKKCRIVDFQFSRTTTYALEVGDQYMRFFSAGAPILSGASPYEIVTPWLEADLFQLQWSQINDVVYFCHPDHPVQKLSRVTDTSWTLAEVVFDVPALLEENITATTITASALTGTGITLTASSSIFESGHVGSYWQIAHVQETGQNLPLNITGTSGELWIRGAWSFLTTGTWSGTILIQRSDDDGATWETVRTYEGALDRNVNSTGNEEEGALYRVDFTYVSSSGPPTPQCYLEAADVFYYGQVKITGYTSGTQVTADVIYDLYATTATTHWFEGAWSDVRGYPRTATLFEQRLFFAGSTYQPQTVWGSVVGDYENFRRGSIDDDSFAYTLGATERNAIEWIVAQKALILGTSGGEWSMGAGTGDEPLSPTNVVVRRQSSYGSKNLQAQIVNEVVLFIQRTGRKVRELVFSFEKDGYVAPDMTLLSEHITAGGIVCTAYQQQNDSILWAVTGDGNLIGMTYERDQNVTAWHRHVTDGSFESVAAIYGESSDEIWFSVKRTIGGVTKRFIERFNPTVWTDKEDAFYVDSGLTYDGSAATTISGLDHLEGKTVSILADGAVVPDQVVTSGDITLTTAASVVHAGLKFETIFEPMKLDTDPAAGVTIGREKRIREVVVRFLDSLGLKWSDDNVAFTEFSFRDTSDPMDDSPPLFSGDKVVEWDGDFDTDPRLILKQDQPLPMTVLAVIPKYNITGR